MLKYLIKNTAEIRVEDEDAANELHKEYEDFARDAGFVLNSWSQTLRTKKQAGEVVDSWYICKVVLVFNDAKEPDIPLNSIDFNMKTNISIDDIKPWDEV